MNDTAKGVFRDAFGFDPRVRYYAPGQITLARDQTAALLCGIDRGIVCAASARSDGMLRIVTESGIAAYHIDDTAYHGDWTDAVRRAAAALRHAGYPLTGADMAFSSKLPRDEGVGYTAALVTAAGGALRALYGLVPLSDEELVRLLSYSGDHRAIHSCMMARKNTAMLQSAHGCAYLPLASDRAAIVLLCTAFNGAADLADGDRLCTAARVLKDGDYPALGALMRATHRATQGPILRELNLLTEAAWATKGVYGARAIGGCTLNLVEPLYLNLFVKRMADFYEDMWDRQPRLMVVRPSDGAHRLNDNG